MRVQQSTIAFQDEGKTAVFEVDDVILIQLLQAVLGDFDRAEVGVQNGVVVRVFRIIRSEREHAAVRSAAAVGGAHVQREFLGHPQFFQSLHGIFCERQFHFLSPLVLIIEHTLAKQIGYAHSDKMFDKVRIRCYI